MPLTHIVINKLLLSTPRLIQSDLTSIVMTVMGCNYGCIPADKMKAKRLHIVPLAPQAMAILEQIKELGFSDQYVFFNTSTRKPYSQNTFIDALWNMGCT